SLSLYNNPATADIDTLSLHDALPIFGGGGHFQAEEVHRHQPGEEPDPAALRIRSRSAQRSGVGMVARLDDHTEDESDEHGDESGDRKSTRLNSSHVSISYAVFCLKKK